MFKCMYWLISCCWWVSSSVWDVVSILSITWLESEPSWHGISVLFSSEGPDGSLDWPVARVKFLVRELELLLRERFWRLKLKTEIVKELLPAPDVRKFKKFMGFNSGLNNIIHLLKSNITSLLHQIYIKNYLLAKKKLHMSQLVMSY